MKFDPVKNPNYVATIVRVEAGNLYKVEGLDNLVGYTKFGMQALVSKDTAPGLYILFSTEVQLSLKYVYENNLHRDGLLNRDKTQVGYLEDNRRVKAISLRKNRSEALLMPVSSLAWAIGKDVAKLQEGDVFDSIGGVEICRKYVIKEPKANTGQQPKARVRRVSTKHFPEHIDTENYFRNSHKMPDHAFVIVTQKLHGTSVRYGNVQTLNTLRWWERMLRRKAGLSHRFVVGSRRVVKSIDLDDQVGGSDYYADGDLWSRYADETKLNSKLPKDILVFGELVGYTASGAQIQKDYTYGEADGNAKLYVYRVATVTTDGRINDLSHGELEIFCAEHGLTPVPILWEGLHSEFKADHWLDKRYHEDWTHLRQTFVQPPVPLSDPKTVDEGICIRYDGPFGVFITKAKSPKFLEHETKLLDAGAEDTESAA